MYTDIIYSINDIHKNLYHVASIILFKCKLMKKQVEDYVKNILFKKKKKQKFSVFDDLIDETF